MENLEKRAVMRVLLSTRNISKSYPGVKALKGIDLDIYGGEVHALVGENGAGKSTLIKVISGAIEPDGGMLVFDGLEYRRMTPLLSTSLGIQIIYQEFNLIPNLSVAENMFMGERFVKRGIVDRRTLLRKAKEILSRIRLDIDPDADITSLSVAHMQLVEIAKAISRDIKLLIMDEPTAPLTNNEVEILFDLIRNLKEQGITVIYITHRLQELFEISDRVTVMRDGALIKTMNTGDATRNELIKLMVGREESAEFPSRVSKPKEEIMLEARNVSGNGVRNISFRVHKGEILGIGGLVGAGRTELVRMLFGADPMEEGSLFIDGRKAHIKNPRQAVGLGMGFVPEDRKLHGTILSFPIQWNVTLTILKELCTGFLRNQNREKECAENQKKILNIKTPNLLQEVSSLSGGNQQKVVLAKWLARNCKILVFDEPTRGIDVGAKLEIYNIMNDLASKGIAIVMISSEMDELLGMADRITVLCEGDQMGDLDRSDFSREKVLQLASGNG
jgi:ribose transport system ATP-binding protein